MRRSVIDSLAGMGQMQCAGSGWLSFCGLLEESLSQYGAGGIKQGNQGGGSG